MTDEPRKPAGTIDLTPTWVSILPIMIACIKDGSPEGQKIAREELARMAGLADLYVAEHKTNPNVA